MYSAINVEGSSADKREIIPDGNSDLHEEDKECRQQWLIYRKCKRLLFKR